MNEQTAERLHELWLSKRASSKDRGIEFALSFEDFLKLGDEQYCYYTGIKMTRKRAGKAMRQTDLTIDRVDSLLGYTPENCVACCHAANVFKSVMEMGSKSILDFSSGAEIINKTQQFLNSREAA